MLSVVIAIPLGVYQAVRRNTIGDYAVTSLAFIVYAMPVFFLGLILIQVFALDLHWFGFEGSQSNSILAIIGDWHDMILPIVTLTLLTIASFSRYMRSTAMDVLAQDYIKVARAKGLPERLVLMRHLLRNACLPMVTLIGLSIPLLLAGNLITETLFNYNGLGLLFYTAPAECGLQRAPRLHPHRRGAHRHREPHRGHRADRGRPPHPAGLTGQATTTGGRHGNEAPDRFRRLT